MAMARKGVTLVAGGLLCWAGASTAMAAPTVAQMLNFRPKQEGINFSTPTAEEQKSCKVELATGARPGSNGWLLRDGTGRPLRRYFDSNGDKKVDTWSYYLDGVEVYREVDSNYNEKVDQYRWMNAGGMKWGVDINEDGKIDTWKYISAEELSQEILQAYTTKDLARLQALFITDTEMKALDLPTADANRLRQLQAGAATKVPTASAKLAGFGEKVKWVRFDANVPQCVPAEQTGLKIDLIKQFRCTVLYENGGKHDFLPIGEMILVGNAWRLTDVPSADTEEKGAQDSPKVKEKLEALRKHDPQQPVGGGPELVRWNMKRAELILAIMADDKPEQRETWTRQLVECYSAAAQGADGGDKAAYDMLAKIAGQVVKEQPGSAIASFAAFREMQAWYAMELAKVKNPNDFPKIQGQWLDRLTGFAQTYAHTDETAEALMQLGMVCEFLSKEVEAKNWYGKLIKDFPNHPQCPKAGGAIRRLEIEGKTFELTCPDKGSTFDIAKLKGKVVIVYYWASWNQQCIGDFANLKVLLSKYGTKGLELVCVNVDSGPPEADGAKVTPPGGVQLAQPGGLDSPLAVQYGIHSLPTMFLVGADGKAISAKVQVGTLDDEVKKVLK
jgi:thiol-disulfide isomerase/thioredoxin